MRTSPAILKCHPTERAQLLHNKCNKMGLTKNTDVTFFPKQLFVVEEHRLVVCLPAKTGSSNFKDILIRSSQRYRHASQQSDIEQEALHSTDTLRYFGINSLNDYKRDVAWEMLHDYTKVVVVRNPMARVYSAYREKLVRRFANETCARHRKHMAPWIAHVTRPNTSDARPGHCPRTDITFTEFMEAFTKYPHLIKTDVHWSSVEEDCLLCILHYDQVLRLETGASDLRHFVRNIVNQSESVIFVLNIL